MVSPRREDYTNEALEAIERAHAWASDMRNARLDAEHLALGMLSIKDGMATKIFDFLGADVGEIKKDLEFFVYDLGEALKTFLKENRNKKNMIELFLYFLNLFINQIMNSDHVLIIKNVIMN